MVNGNDVMEYQEDNIQELTESFIEANKELWIKWLKHNNVGTEDVTDEHFERFCEENEPKWHEHTMEGFNDRFYEP